MFTIVTLFFVYQGSTIELSAKFFLIPLLLLQMAVLGLGAGIFISAMTIKYRDFTFMIGFGLQIWMYLSPVIYPLSQISEKYAWAYHLNPMVSIIEHFRFFMLGAGEFMPTLFFTSWAITLSLLVVGTLAFNRAEQDFMDTV